MERTEAGDIRYVFSTMTVTYRSVPDVGDPWGNCWGMEEKQCARDNSRDGGDCWERGKAGCGLGGQVGVARKSWLERCLELPSVCRPVEKMTMGPK